MDKGIVLANCSKSATCWRCSARDAASSEDQCCGSVGSAKCVNPRRALCSCEGKKQVLVFVTVGGL